MQTETRGLQRRFCARYATDGALLFGIGHRLRISMVYIGDCLKPAHTEMKMERVFQPWIGANYRTGSAHNCRILILGESHYGKPADARLDFTNYIVGRYAITERRRFFSVVQRLVSLDTKRGSYSRSSKRTFWNSVAFCNFVQAIVGSKARQRPTAAMWDTGASVLLQVLKEVQPEVVVVLGQELKKHLPNLPVGIEVAYITHPSGRGMKYSECQPPIRGAIERAVAARRAVDDSPTSSDRSAPSDPRSKDRD